MGDTLLSTAGLWLGFLLSLLAFSAILGDHLLARLAQHMLVGAALGYLLVLVIQNILRPHLWQPLLAGGSDRSQVLVPLLLALLLVGAGLVVMGRGPGGASSQGWVQWMRRMALIPVLVLLGVGLATAAIGSIQGTLLPQMAQSAAWDEGNVMVGLLMLLTTTGVLLHLYVEPYVEQIRRTHDAGHGWGGHILQRLLAAWTWLGQRMLWLAAGVLFARLVAARLSLLIARFEYFVQTMQETSIGRAIVSLLQRAGG